ncbi:MAG: inosine/xanthosine triphosphatase [Gemmatimonadaceae bacterium]|nr:inosine/xanthosine triphosphatase [Gemmatimonadaceae bacterium]
MSELLRTVAVGSANPVKLAAARAVLASVAPEATVRAVPVPSGVPDQPFGDEETIAGARNRARAARALDDADLGVGLEGGVVETPGGMRSNAWCVVVHRDGREGVGGSLAMPLPDAVARMVREGTELGHAMDALVAARGTKHGKGAVGILTDGRIDRQAAYEVLVTYALAPFITPELYAR